MTDSELVEFFDLLDGFMAYDCGATDSGIKDAKRRAEAMAYLTSLDRDTRLLLIGRYLWHYDEGNGRGGRSVNAGMVQGSRTAVA